MPYKQRFSLAVLLGLAVAAAPAAAQDPVVPAATGATSLKSPEAGFYGGVVLRDGTQEGTGVQIGSLTSAWGKFVAPTGRGGVGLALGAPGDVVAPRTWNADVYTSWAFRKSLALYGRLGYAQSDPQTIYTPASFLTTDPRRPRDGMNYGVGLRYDVTRALGLRLEYARFGRFAGESVNGLLPESDQVQFGMQYRF